MDKTRAMFWTRTCAATLAALLLPLSIVAQGDEKRGEPEFWVLSKAVQKAVDNARASVVTVETFGGFRKILAGAAKKKPAVPGLPKPKDPKKDDKKKKGLGPIRMPGFIQAQGASTGLVIAKDGWILTSSFALNWNPSSILVTLDDGRKFTATVAGRDETRGIALLHVDSDDLPVPTFAPLEEIETGQWAFAVARSLAGKGPTVHVGTVSALRRISGKAIQCDANTSPANYGGPLIDLRGRVLGIIAPLAPQGEAAGVNWYDSGIGFAATVQDIGEILEGMKEGKVYRRARLGVVLDPSKLGPGAVITSAPRGTAAYAAGLKKGDEILSVEGEDIRNSMHLQDRIGYCVAGDWITLRYRRKRDGGTSKVLVQLDG